MSEAWKANRNTDNNGTPYESNYGVHIFIEDKSGEVICGLWAPVGDTEREQLAERIAAMPTQLSTMTAQCDDDMDLLCRIAAALTGQEEPSHDELAEIDFVHDIEQLRKQRDAAVEACKRALAVVGLHQYPEGEGPLPKQLRAAIAAAGEAP